MRANGFEQVVGVHTGRDDDQRAHTSAAALVGDAGHGFRGYAQHRQLRRLGQLHHRRVAVDVRHRLRVRVDRVEIAGEVALHQVAQHDVSDRSRRPARAHHRDRTGLQHVGQARHIGCPFPFRNGVEVALAGFQAEVDVHDVAVGHDRPHQTHVGEHAQHPEVGREHLRREAAHTSTPCQRHEVFEQQGADTMCLLDVRHDQRDFCPVGLTDHHVTGRSEQLVAA